MAQPVKKVTSIQQQKVANVPVLQNSKKVEKPDTLIQSGNSLLQLQPNSKFTTLEPLQKTRYVRPALKYYRERPDSATNSTSGYYQDGNQLYETKSESKPIDNPPVAEQILQEIERAAVSISRKNIDFHISNSELIITGVKQPESVHKQVLEKVLKSPYDKLNYTYGHHE